MRLYCGNIEQVNKYFTDNPNLSVKDLQVAIVKDTPYYTIILDDMKDSSEEKYQLNLIARKSEEIELGEGSFPVTFSKNHMVRIAYLSKVNLAASGNNEETKKTKVDSKKSDSDKGDKNTKNANIEDDKKATMNVITEVKEPEKISKPEEIPEKKKSEATKKIVDIVEVLDKKDDSNAKGKKRFKR